MFSWWFSGCCTSWLAAKGSRQKSVGKIGKWWKLMLAYGTYVDIKCFGVYLKPWFTVGNCSLNYFTKAPLPSWYYHPVWTSVWAWGNSDRKQLLILPQLLVNCRVKLCKTGIHDDNMDTFNSLVLECFYYFIIPFVMAGHVFSMKKQNNLPP